MHRWLFIILVSGLISTGKAQILFENGRNQALLPSLPDSMSYTEYEMLTRSLNWQRLMIASFVPGYIHYYARHQKAAYTIAAIRTTGMILSTTGMLLQWNESKQINLKFITDMETNFYLFLAGFILNTAGYAYDIAHGDYIISKEKTTIQFKFRRIIVPGCVFLPHKNIPALGMAFSF